MNDERTVSPTLKITFMHKRKNYRGPFVNIVIQPHHIVFMCLAIDKVALFINCISRLSFKIS